MLCVTHLHCFFYHYKLREHLMNNRESRMNSSMFHFVTIYYNYWAKLCLQIHTALIEACPLYLFLKIKALLLVSQRTSVTWSIVKLWISFFKSSQWGGEHLPGTGHLRDNSLWAVMVGYHNYLHPNGFQKHVTPCSCLIPHEGSGFLPCVTQGWAGMLVGRFVQFLECTTHCTGEEKVEHGLGWVGWFVFWAFWKGVDGNLTLFS